nr:HAD-IC family P-type ATPase [Propionibacterium sp.]
MPATLPGAHAGLTDAEVAARRAKGQVNTLPPRSGRTVADIVRANVFTRINAILSVLLVIVLATGSWINAAFGLLIIVNSGIGIVQELRAKRTLDNLAVVGEAQPTVRRASGTQPRHRDEIVLDDIIEIGPGDQIVVDGEVVESDYLEVDESLLTGENDPEPKPVGATVLSGSFVVAGSGAYRTTKVGAEAYAAQLTAEASRFTLVRSELQQDINQILRLITFLLVPVGLATIFTQWALVGGDWRQAVLRMAGALVPMVPEGLVLLTSMAFALGVIRLGRRQCLVQELPAIEGLARVDVVCADKTGTLTETGMRCSRVEPLAPFTAAEVTDALAQLAVADARPNASILAIREALPAPPDPWTVAARAPFTSAKKWSGVSFVGRPTPGPAPLQPGADHAHWILGAPDVLASGPIADRAEELGRTGLRVLLLCSTDTPVDAADAPVRPTPAALVVLEQKVRPDAADTLAYFAAQDVAVKVISGDNAAAVGAVTRTLGVVTGDPVDARTLDDDTLPAAVASYSVFGRVTPHQKRAMVAALQSQGRTVAMTGDGVNDVLALKDADLGVAMGSGASATRSVAKIVLLDDRFATLPHVVAEGRRVIGNIERVANLFLTKTVYSAVLALLVVLWQLPFPFLPIHVTITGWFTIGIPAFLLSLAPNHERARPGFVLRVLRLGLPAGLVIAAASFTTYALLRSQAVDAQGATQASTAALAALIVSATWVLAVVARPYQWWKIGLIVLSLAAYALIFTLPFTQALFVLDSSNVAFMETGLLIGAVGAAAIEGLWWARARFFGEQRQFWAVVTAR